MTLAQAGRMIDRLSRQPVDAFTGRENLNAAVDRDIRVETVFPRHGMSLMVGGERVSWTGIYDFRQQIGPHWVRMGGIAGVGTHNDHRFKGYSRTVMVNSLRWMRREGFDVAMLFGITGFYPKFGYAPVMPTVTHTMAVRDAELVPRGKIKFVEFADDHLPIVLALYRQTHAGRTGIIHRDPKTWVPFRRNKAHGLRVAVRVGLDARKQVRAYFAHDLAQDAAIVEAGYASPAVFGDLLRAASDLAWEARAGTISFRLPADDAFMAWCRPLGLKQETIHQRDGGGMIRMIHIPATLAKVAPLLASRLARAGLAAGALAIRTNLDDVGLRWSRGRLTVGPPVRGGARVRLPQWALAQLLYGYGSVETLRAAGHATGTKAGLEALAAMTPPGECFVCPVDVF